MNDQIDLFCRAYLLEMIDSTKYNNYDGLVEYIIHEASYEQVLLAVFDQKTFLKEDSSVEISDAERASKIQSIEKSVRPVLNIGLALIAGTERIEGPVKNAINNLLKNKTRGIGGFLKGSNMAGTAGFITGQIALSVISYLVTRMVSVMYEKSISVCRKQCKKITSSSAELKKLNIEICTCQCKINGLNRLIVKLRSDISDCNKSQNPEKCQTNLVKQVSKYNDQLITQQDRMKKLKDKLNRFKKSNK